MKTKTFKIGEYAIGGIIVAKVAKDGKITIECRDWDSKELIQGYFSYEIHDIQHELFKWTSYYWAEKITDWIEDKRYEPAN